MRTSEEVAAAVRKMLDRGSTMPLPLLAWVARQDPNERPPAIDGSADTTAQQNIINNELRRRDPRYGMFERGGGSQ
jgi:hypothetical protein